MDLNSVILKTPGFRDNASVGHNLPGRVWFNMNCVLPKWLRITCAELSLIFFHQVI